MAIRSMDMNQKNRGCDCAREDNRREVDDCYQSVIGWRNGSVNKILALQG